MSGDRVVGVRCASTARLASFFCLRFPLLFLTLQFLLTLLEADAHRPPHIRKVLGLPARFAGLAGGLSVVLV